MREKDLECTKMKDGKKTLKIYPGCGRGKEEAYNIFSSKL